MKKLYCSLLALGCALGVKSQILFNMLGPQNVAGTYEITWTDAADGWGTVDMNDPANAVTDTLAFVDDGTAADSLGCEVLVNPTDVSGKIAVVYRGTCEFGVKAYNAQTAGAVAVIIINNISGSPVGMGAGTMGAEDSIPIVMISDADGAFLRQSILNGNAVGFIGSVTDLYTDDVGFFRTDVLLPKFGGNPLLLSANGTEYNFDLGVWLNNYGSNDQTGITVTADVSQNGSSVFSVTSDPIDLISNDSAIVDLGIFQLPAYSGDYTLTYTANMPTSDVFTQNNSYSATFTFGDIFTYAPVDFTTHMPISSTHVPGNATQPYQICVHFRDANASRVGVPGIWFSAVPTVAGTPIENEIFEIQAYKWTDDFTGMVDVVSPPTLEQLVATEFVYPSTPPGQMVFAQYGSPVILEDDQRYLFCLSTFTELIRVGYNSVLQYDRTQTLYDQPITQFFDGTDWFVGGFTGGGTSSIGVVMFDAETIGLDEHGDGTTATPYPNPTSGVLNIPLKGRTDVATVEIIDALGSLVGTQRGNVAPGSLLLLDVSDLDRATYTVRLIFTDGSRTSFKAVVNR